VLVVTLTTPVPRDIDSVFPGENWFFYWKTAASLWRIKLQEFPGTRIIVPLNWSFHSETGDNFDFDEHRPETNLLKLVSIAKEVGKSVVFFLPVTPAPFLPNGGLPHFLARGMALNREGMAYGVIDNDDNLIKIYSFFDPRVFEGFNRFVRSLGKYFLDNGINVDVWGLSCGYFENGNYKSFMEDSSLVYEQAFSRFLSTKKDKDQAFSPLEEKQYAFEFNKTMHELYATSARESIGPAFEGVLDVAFLGAATEKFLKRLHGNLSTKDYTEEIYESLAKDIIPSSVLIPARVKQGVLLRQLNDLIANSYLPARLETSSYEQSNTSRFSPLCFFKVYEKIDGLSSIFQSWEQMDLWDFLRSKFGWNYKIISSLKVNLQHDKNPQPDNIHFFHGHDIDKEMFTFILKTFLSAGKIILNRSGLSDDMNKKLETFFLENNLMVEKVNFFTSIHNIILGDGRLIIFDGEELSSQNQQAHAEFWHKIIETFAITHVPIENAAGIDYYWRTRGAQSSELNFEEIRRLSLYNPTSYRKKLKMNLMKNFVVYKVLDEINVSVRTSPNEVDIELAPEGSVVMDFGVFS
jgi:hypothetical protein